MAKWRQIDKSVREDGTTITYAEEHTPFLIQSRKKHIPHSGRPGTWDHTTYFVLYRGFDVKEFWTLKDAKEWAENSKQAEGSDYDE